MSKVTFTKDKHVRPLTLVLVRKDFSRIGVIHGSEITFKDNFNEPDELSCKVYKYVDGMYNQYWDHINDFNAIYVPELDTDGAYFEIQVSTNEEQNGVYKSITGTALAEAELANTKVYDLEINTDFEMENDPDWSKDYHTVFYRDLSPYEDDPEEYRKMKHVSLLHRILDKAENYSIKHVDDTLLNLKDWYQFSINESDIYTVLTQDIAEQYHVWFKFDSTDRTVSAYDLYSTCMNNNCSYRTQMYTDRKIRTRYRGDFKHKCPYCGSTNITPGYGIDTKILVSKDNLMSSASISSNKDNLKNCFRLSGGDDLMTAAIMNQNPNGSQYIYQFSAEQKAEMPTNLVNKIEQYNTEYDKYYNGELSSGKGIYNFDSNSKVIYIKNATTAYERLVNSAKKTRNAWRQEYNLFIDFLNDQGFSEGSIGEFEKVESRYIGYQALATIYYKTIDLEEFVLDSMVPDVEVNHDSLADTVAKLNRKQNIDPIGVTNPQTTSISIVNSAILQVAKCVCNTALYDISIDESYQNTWTPAASASGTGTWKGRFIVSAIEYKDTDQEEENTAYSNLLTITVNADETTYIKQSVAKLIKTKDARVKSLFDTSDFDDPGSLTPEQAAQSLLDFENNLKHYGLNFLTNIVRPAYSDVQGVLLKASKDIQDIYKAYYDNRKKAIDRAIKQREDQYLAVLAMRASMEYLRDSTQEKLNFGAFLGDALWKVFCSYRREDSYSNQYYISDGLTNAEIMDRARDTMDEAQKELYKVSHLQYDLSADLYDLLNIPEFNVLLGEFATGNWIHLDFDGKIYDLRLLSYEVDYNDLSSIKVEFSTIEQLWSGASDIKSVLDAAGSIAGSYSNFSQQVKRSVSSTTVVKNWMKKGLDATYVKYVNNPDTQEIVYDESGLLARSIIDTGGYDERQVKLLGSGLYTTSDNWASVDAAIGAITYFNPETNQYVNDYGVIAKTIVGNLILGNNLKIFNQSGSFKITDDGMEYGNTKNTFIVNPNNNNELLCISKKVGSTTQKIFYVDSNGVLHITGDGAGIDLTSNETVSQVVHTAMGDYSTTVQMEAAISASAQAISSYVSQTYETKTNAGQAYGDIRSEISQTAGSITQTVSNNYTELNGKIKTNSDNISTLNQTATEISATVSSNYTDLNGRVSTNTSNIALNADNIALKVNTSDYTGTKLVSMINLTPSEIKLAASKITLEGIVTANNYFKIKTDGSMEATNGKFSGQITAESGSIGGWTISKNYQIGYSDTVTQGVASTQYTVFMRSNQSYVPGTDTITPADSETRAFGVYHRQYNGSTFGDWVADFYVTHGGRLYANDAVISGKLTARSGVIGGFTIGDVTDTSCAQKTTANGGHRYYNSMYSQSNDGTTYEYEAGMHGSSSSPNDKAFYIQRHNRGATWANVDDIFYVRNDGYLYAQNANIKGTITANSGSIGGFVISTVTNTGTTADGGHAYRNSLYTHSSDTNYEYEAGIAGGGTPTNSVFYIRRMDKDAAWSTSTTLFYVRNDGYIYAEKGKIAGWILGSHQFYRDSHIDTSVTTAQTAYRVAIRGQKMDGSDPVSSTEAFHIQQRTYTNGTYGSWSDNLKILYDGSITLSKSLNVIVSSSTQKGQIFVGTGLASNDEGCYISYDSDNHRTLIKAKDNVYYGALGIEGKTVSITGTTTTGVTLQAGTGTNPYRVNVQTTIVTAGNSTSNVHIGQVISHSPAVFTNGIILNGNSNINIALGTGVVPVDNADEGVVPSDGSYIDGVLVTGETAVLGHLVASKSISVQSSSAAAYAFKLINSAIEGQFRISSEGNIGLYDNTRSKWIIYKTGIAALTTAVTITENTSITGTVTATGNYSRKLTDYTRGTAPSSALYSSYVFTDKNNATISYLQSVVATNGNHSLNLVITTPTSEGGNTSVISLTKNSSGVATCSIAGNTTVSGAITTTGNINISTTSTSSFAIGVQNGAGRVQMYMSGTGNMGLYDATGEKYIIYKNSSGHTIMPYVLADNTTAAGNLFMESNGRIRYGGGSSRRYKKDIVSLTDWKKVLDIPVVSFKYKEDYLSQDDQRYGIDVPGFIAEDVDVYYPIAAEKQQGVIEDWNVRYIVPPMLAVAQDHERRIKELEEELARLKALA